MRTAVVATANFLIIIANSLDLVSLAPAACTMRVASDLQYRVHYLVEGENLP